jgi:hypothetical protein
VDGMHKDGGWVDEHTTRVWRLSMQSPSSPAGMSECACCACTPFRRHHWECGGLVDGMHKDNV